MNASNRVRGNANLGKRYKGIAREAATQQSCPLQEIQCEREGNEQQDGRQRKTNTVRAGSMVPLRADHRARSTNDNEESQKLSTNL